MWFKNLMLYWADEPFSFTAGDLEDALKANICQPPGTQTMFTEGFAHPIAGQEQMVYAESDFLLLTYRQDSRMLPGAVVKAELDEKVKAIESEEDRKVGRKEKAELKEQIVFNLMPRAFIKSQITPVLIDMRRHRVMVNTSSAKRAEEAIACLRKTLGSMPVAYPAPKSAPYTSFANWMRDTKLLPEGYTLGDGAALKGTKDDGSKLSFNAMDLSQEEILAHLETGMVPVKLNMVFHDTIEFNLTEKLEIKSIKPLDLIQENLDSIDADDVVEEMQARISLQGDVLREAVDVLFEYFECDKG